MTPPGDPGEHHAGAANVVPDQDTVPAHGPPHGGGRAHRGAG